MIPVRRPWTQKPPAGVRLNKSHPLSNGLIFATTFGGNPFEQTDSTARNVPAAIDHVKNRIPTSVNSGGNDTLEIARSGYRGAQGWHQQTDNNDTNDVGLIYGTDYDVKTAATNNVLMVARVRHDGNTQSGWARIVSQVNTAGNSDEFAIGIDGGSNAFGRIAGTSLLTISFSLSTGTWYTIICWRAEDGDGHVELYDEHGRDLLDSATAGTAAMASSTGNLTIGHRDAGNRTWDGWIDYCYIWSWQGMGDVTARRRAQAIAANPWQIFQPRTFYIPTTTPAAGGLIPIRRPRVSPRVSRRSNASGDILYTTQNLPANMATSEYAYCGFIRVANDRSLQWRFFAGMEDTVYPTDSAGWALLGWDTSNIFQLASSGTPSLDAFSNPPPVDGTWFFFAVSNDGTNSDGYWKLVGANRSGWGGTATLAVDNIAPSQFSLFADTYDEWVDSNIVGFRRWSRALTVAELHDEAEQIYAKHRRGLVEEVPLTSPGVPRNWNEAGSITLESQHPFVRDGRTRTFYIPGGAAAGGPTDITGTEAILFGQAADILGRGVIDATEAALFAQSADILGRGVIDGTEAVLFGQSVDILGRGIVEAAAEAILFGESVDILGRGIIEAAAEAILFGESADVLGRGIIEVAGEAVIFDRSANLTDGNVTGPITATEAVIFGESVNILGRGLIEVTGAVVFGESGNILGRGNVQVTEAVVFDRSANLQDANAAATTRIFIIT